MDFIKAHRSRYRKSDYIKPQRELLRASRRKLTFPGVGGEEDEHGEYLQPAEEHIKAQNALAEQTELRNAHGEGI